jgi:hypothetical protein
MGVPPPPGSARGPVGSPRLASCFRPVEPPAKVKAQHAPAVLRALRLDHLAKTNPAQLAWPRKSTTCKTAFAVTSLACRATGSDPFDRRRVLKRPVACGEFAARHGPPRFAQPPRTSRPDLGCRRAWLIHAPWRNRRRPPSNDHLIAARSSGDAPSASLAASLRGTV